MKSSGFLHPPGSGLAELRLIIAHCGSLSPIVRELPCKPAANGSVV
jgi:hypothetical protein